MEKYKNLLEILPEDAIELDASMKKYTTMKVGGNASAVVTPKNLDEIKTVLKYAKENKIELYVLGNGSNVIVDDDGIDGIVLKLGNKFSNIEVKENKIYVSSGASMPKVALVAKQNSLSGFEFASGIPGTIGGGIKMNAGAYGSEMANVLESVTYIDENYNLVTITNKDCNFSYRHSIFSEHKEFVIIEAVLSLEKGNLEEIESKMKEYQEARSLKQPLEYANSGSIFKRPEGYFVGKLVQDAGLKGKTIGKAQVSTKHSGFIINLGDATCSDIKELIKFIQDEVKEKFGVMLQTEVEFIGGNKK